MKESNISLAFKLIQDLKMVTAEIEEMNTFAKQAASVDSNQIKISIEIPEQFEGVNKRPEDTMGMDPEAFFEKRIAAAMGIDFRYLKSEPAGMNIFDKFEKTKSKHLLSKVSETTLLSVLGCLLSDKIKIQNQIIIQLENLGVIL